MNDLHLSLSAQNDLKEIKAYISEELGSPKAALNTVARMTKAISRLREHAYIGTSLASITPMGKDYRFLVCGSYMVFYRVTGKAVYVDRVIYGRRDYISIIMKDVHLEDMLADPEHGRGEV